MGALTLLFAVFRTPIELLQQLTAATDGAGRKIWFLTPAFEKVMRYWTAKFPAD